MGLGTGKKVTDLLTGYELVLVADEAVMLDNELFSLRTKFKNFFFFVFQFLPGLVHGRCL